MKIIGITGSIATGKTTVSSLFNNIGIPVFHDDKVVKNILESKTLLKYFNNDFKESIIHNSIDKNILKKIVFDDYNKLLKLENIIHPLVNEKRRLFILKNKILNKSEFIVLDTPLLFEANINKICDFIIVTNCSYELIKKRALNRKNLSENDLDFILKRQLPTNIKLSKADFSINTEFSIENTKEEVQKILKNIKFNI